MVIRREGCGLHHKHVFAANIFLNFDEDFLIGKSSDAGFSKRDVQIAANGICQLPTGITRENLHCGPPVAFVMGRFLATWPSIASDLAVAQAFSWHLYERC
ncbi:hypothetical protein J2Z17_004072 [Rhizobium halophytocola]|uniref:Uncharacterized protein n=1 Tax=Rhizobium halophytocola TaxID=735519 RepID=A0ABS4E3T7_9HYPH|nr:hypothetical protein [Rhizobium halophytocola]